MLYFTCTTITSVDLAHYGVSRVKIGYLWIVVQLEIIVLILHENVGCDHPLKPSRRDGIHEKSQHAFSLLCYDHSL